MIEWTTATKIVVQGAKQGYTQRHAIQKFWVNALAKLDVGGTDVVVTGHSGAGKSTLAGQMHGRARDLFFNEPEESIKVEVEAITLGEWTKLVRILPGQAGRRTHGEIEAFDDNPSLEGVIHVVDFGYVMPRDAGQREALLQVEGLNTIEKLREHNLRHEVEDLQGLLTNLRRSRVKNKAPKWLMIAVNKFDLFCNRTSEALDFYHPAGSGSFGKALRKFQSEEGANNFGIYVGQTCAYESDFEWNGEVVGTGLTARGQEDLLKKFMLSIACITEKHK